MTYEVPSTVSTTTCAFFTFSGTPTLNNPLTPNLVGSSTGAGITVSSNDIQLPQGEYILRFFGAITRTSGSKDNMQYQWREVGGSLIGIAGATNRGLSPASRPASIDPADAHLEVGAGGVSVRVEVIAVGASISIDSTSCHAVIWRVS